MAVRQICGAMLRAGMSAVNRRVRELQEADDNLAAAVDRTRRAHWLLLLATRRLENAIKMLDRVEEQHLE